MGIAAAVHIVAMADLPGKSWPLGCGWRGLKLRWLYPLDGHRRLEAAQDRRVQNYGNSWPHCGPRRVSVGSGGWSWPCL